MYSVWTSFQNSKKHTCVTWYIDLEMYPKTYSIAHKLVSQFSKYIFQIIYKCNSTKPNIFSWKSIHLYLKHNAMIYTFSCCWFMYDFEFKYSWRFSIFTVCFLNNNFDQLSWISQGYFKAQSQRHTIIYSLLSPLSIYCTWMTLKLLQTNKKKHSWSVNYKQQMTI